MTPEDEIQGWESDPSTQDVVLRAALEFQAAVEQDGCALDRLTAQMEAARLRALAAPPKSRPVWWRIS